MSPEVVEGWLQKGTKGPKRVFNTQKREHNEGWIMKQIEELLEFAQLQENSSLVLYAALEARNLIEMVEYNIVKTSTAKNKWSEIEKEAKEKNGIQKVDKYNTLKKKYQLFYQFVADTLDVESYAFDLAEAIRQKNVLAIYIHSYTLNEEVFKYNSTYIQEGMKAINEVLTSLNNFFSFDETEGKYGNLVFETLPEEYIEALDLWKQNPSDDIENLEKIFSQFT